MSFSTKRMLGTMAAVALLAVSAWGQDDPALDTRSASAARTSSGKMVAKPKAVKVPTKPALPVPLTERERAQQMLNRFTFGARPGEVERVLGVGVDKWFEAQMQPEAIKDDALDRRLRDFPTLTITPEQALLRFPDRGAVERVAQGKVPAPTDPLLASLYEVQVFKYKDDLEKNKVDASGKKAYEPTPAEVDAQKKAGQAVAARIAGDLFTLPANQRMGALIKLTVAERIAFTNYLQGSQRNLLLGEFNPTEREVFTAMAANVASAGQIGQELAQAKMVRAILSERQLQEVMADFWFNHFNVFIGKDADQWYTTSYDREAIRRHALGKFRDLLLATAESPAMLIYLDNWLSIGPESKANAPGKPGGKPGNKGLNENYGREVMELHTVGVNGGYTQADVTALAAILTGWGVDRPYGGAGGFLFDAKKHEPGVKLWFGHTIGMVQQMSSIPGQAVFGQPDPGMQEGIQALTILAASPKTAHFISWKLAQRFVADDPPAALVDRMAKAYLASDGDIREVLRTLERSPEFNSRLYFRNKVKTPVEYLASAFRTTATDPGNPGDLVNTARKMGMPLFFALPPTGYYLTAEQWMNSSALVDRLNFAYALTNNKFANQKFDAPRVLALGLLAQPALVSTTGIRTAGIRTAVYAPVHDDGMAVALRVLETTMIGGAVSAKTDELIHRQVDEQPGLNAGDRLSLLTALVMGSPEFQVR